MSKIPSFIKGKDRFYCVAKDVVVPSVTTILSVINKPGLKAWESKKTMETLQKLLIDSRSDGSANRFLESLRSGDEEHSALFTEATDQARDAPTKEMNVAASFGSRAHEMLQMICEGKTWDQSEDLKPVAEGFFAFIHQEAADLEIFQTEQVVYSLKHRYAGTVDAFAVRRPAEATQEIIVLDWKTSNSVYNEYAMQVAAYAKAYEEMYETPVKEAWIVKFDKLKPKYQVKKVANLDHSFDCFRSCLTLYNALKGSLFVKN